MKSYELIQAVKEKLNLESDNQAALNIGITRATVSNHKTGKCKTLNDEQCITVAKILGVSAEKIIADQHLEGAKTPEERAVWQNFLKYAGSAAAMLTGVALALPQQILNAPLCILCSIGSKNGNQRNIEPVM